jgi:membrane-bound lytic murein transglycosylase A
MRFSLQPRQRQAMTAILEKERSASPRLTPVAFDDLPGFAADDHFEAFETYLRSARALCAGLAPTRPAQRHSIGMLTVARAALSARVENGSQAREFFRRWFRPWRVDPGESRANGFLTGYYEPVVAGSLEPNAEFTGAILARPPDLTGVQPYPERAAIEADVAQGKRAPILWLRDDVEVFLAQVQGSARVDLEDRQRVRLAYDGRNGQPYTSIGRILIEAGEIAQSDMSLGCLKGWLRGNGLAPGGKARALMQSNRSYVFFKLIDEFNEAEGPTGGAGIPLTALRSIAVDRAIWAYGAAFWIDADLPWRGDAAGPFRRLMIAQDTGSAILGPARADLYFGAGEAAGLRAGAIRHAATFTALLPREGAT